MCNIMLVGRDKSSGGYGVEMKLWRMRLVHFGQRRYLSLGGITMLCSVSCCPKIAWKTCVLDISQNSSRFAP